MRLSIGSSRKSKNWLPHDYTWYDLIQAVKEPVVTKDTLTEYLGKTKDEQDDIKDVGGFVGGTLNSSERRKNNVIARSLITLDADNLTADGFQTLENRIRALKVSAAVYSTRKSTTDRPRVRVLIPLTKDCTAEQYEPIARKLCEKLGMTYFDKTTAEVSRLMYWPSVSVDQRDSYIFRTYGDGVTFLDPDSVLAEFSDWADIRQWPVFPGVDNELKKRSSRQQDPTEKSGMIGAFCRSYTVDEAIAKFLPDVYEPCGDDRYTYKTGSTSAGAIVYQDGKFLYSNHATDPAGGHLCNAYDLVRLHKFGESEDSRKAMQDFVVKDEQTLELLKHEQLDNALTDFSGINVTDGGDDFIEKLETDNHGKIKPSIYNVRTILNNDPNLKGRFFLDLYSGFPRIRSAMPWEKREQRYPRQWGNSDDSGLRGYVEQVYGIVGPQKVTDGLNLALEDNTEHPIKKFLEGTQWDGVERLDTLLIDYLGANDTLYTRQVIRKALVAGATRIYRPGAKFDNMPILVGPQGIGKSTFIAKLGRDWFSDSLSEFEGPKAYEMLQKNWILEIPELEGFGKYRMNTIKKFLSKQTDEYRVPYTARTVEYPRKNIIFGTTNDAVFLRDRTGNRRFWPVQVGEHSPKLSVFDDLTGDVVAQIWAEAYTDYVMGEDLIMTKEAAEQAMKEQEERLEDDPREGQIEAFIKIPIPIDWDKRDLQERRFFYNDPEADDVERVPRQKICAAEVWCELFRYEMTSLDKAKARDINQILESITGERRKMLRFGPEYGPQRGFLCNKSE